VVLSSGKAAVMKAALGGGGGGAGVAAQTLLVNAEYTVLAPITRTARTM
jgi:hypothetical protein